MIIEHHKHHIFTLDGDLDTKASIESFAKSLHDQIRELTEELFLTAKGTNSFCGNVEKFAKEFAEQKKSFPKVILEVWKNHFQNLELKIPHEALLFIASEKICEEFNLSRQMAEETKLRARLANFCSQFDCIEFISGSDPFWQITDSFRSLMKSTPVPSSNS
jgi:hypothetical protein